MNFDGVLTARKGRSVPLPHARTRILIRVDTSSVLISKVRDVLRLPLFPKLLSYQLGLEVSFE